MPEPHLHDLPDLATPASRETVPPPFSAIVERARRRRRRTVLGAAATTVGVLAVVAAGTALTLGDRDAAPSPTRPSPTPSTGATPSPTPDADAVVITRDGRLVSYAVNSRGSLLTVWQLCAKNGSRCRTAWQLQAPTGITRGLARGSFAQAEAAGAYVVVTSWNRPGVVVDERGGARPLQEVGPRATAPGDALVRLGKSLAVVDPDSAKYWSVPDADGSDGWVEGTITADGTMWATPSLPAPPIDVRISWLEHGASLGAWQHHTISTTFDGGPASGPVAVANDHVAALSMHDGVDVATYGRFAVTTDAGATWSDLRPSDLPFDNVDAMAATSTGTLYVASTDASGDGRVFRSTDTTWRHFTEVPGARGAYALVTAGKHVVAARGTVSRVEMLSLDDAGRTERLALFR